MSVEALEHAVNCIVHSGDYKSHERCRSTKAVLNHFRFCDRQDKCLLCSNVFFFIIDHSKKCLNSAQCHVPRCDYFKRLFTYCTVEDHDEAEDWEEHK